MGLSQELDDICKDMIQSWVSILSATGSSGQVSGRNVVFSIYLQW